MNHRYLLLLLGVCLSYLPIQAQNWRPFRPNGDVHAFRGASADTVLTLRLDSAAVSGSDSVYYFNRIMRPASSSTWKKSVNNQFGQQLRYNVATRTYALYWNGGPTPVLTLDKFLVLKPFVPVGTTWASIDTDVGRQTTLLSRGTMLLDGVTDSIVTFRVDNAQNVVLSKNYGLVSGPKDMILGFSTARMLTLARRPAPAARTYYNPLTLLDLQVGDELGYQQQPYSAGPFPCYTGMHLSRVLSRQVTADSLIYTFQQQSRTTYSSAPGCSGGSPVTTPVATVRLAASLRTGVWRGRGASFMTPLNADLLTYAYRASPFLNAFDVALPIVLTQPLGSCLPVPLRQRRLYRLSGTSSEFRSGLDALAWEQQVSQGAGVTGQNEHWLVYSRRTVNNTPVVCGSRADFATLLPTKAAQGLTPLQVYPNPATSTATLLLPAPARAATPVRLLDALGRVVRTQLLPVGQTTAALPLAGLAPGLYLVEVQMAGQLPQHIQLQYQP
ncbi:T9SS type A sorting domain-containing protein [Hymenobacter persicinus]|uniref:T9SS type A sorting domain-containing protein n=1 Tax=Hymenobacter persicinus TaxID=2025506 RepID=A0A4Q5L7H9_9BACT|nr:T9SS type A sorting domain-containing protein [Hymenobacter persicinus]RYU76768.1 T9SS type A sorting domain-containing protein [Hymenobacter persicinus]